MKRQAKLRAQMAAPAERAVDDIERVLKEVGSLGAAVVATPPAVSVVSADDTIIEVSEQCRIATARTNVPVRTGKSAMDLLAMSRTCGLGGPRPPQIQWMNIRDALKMDTNGVVMEMLQNSPGRDVKAIPIDQTQEDRHMMVIDDEYRLTMVVITAKGTTYFDVTTRVEMEDGSDLTMSYGNHNLQVGFSGDRPATIGGKAFNVHVMRFKAGRPRNIFLAGSTWNKKTVQEILGGRCLDELMTVYIVLSPPESREGGHNDNAILLSTCMNDCSMEEHRQAMKNAAHLHMFHVQITAMSHGRYCVTGRPCIHPVLPSTVLKSCHAENIASNNQSMQEQARRTDPGGRPLQAQFERPAHNLASVAFRQLPGGPVATLTEPGLQVVSSDGTVRSFCVRDVPTQLTSMPCLGMFLEIDSDISVGHMLVSARMLSMLPITTDQALLFLSSCNPGVRFKRQSAEALIQQAGRMRVPLDDCARDINVFGQCIESIANLEALGRPGETDLKMKAFEMQNCGYVLMANLVDVASNMSRDAWNLERSEISNDQIFARGVCQKFEQIGQLLTSNCTHVSGDIVSRMNELHDLNPIATGMSPAAFMTALLQFFTGVRPLVRSGRYINLQLLQIRIGMQAVFATFVQLVSMRRIAFGTSETVVVGGVQIPIGAVAYKKLGVLVSFANGKVLQPFYSGDEGKKVDISPTGVKIDETDRYMLWEHELPCVVGIIRKVTPTHVEVDANGGLTKVALPDYARSLIIDSGCLDELFLGCHVSRAYVGRIEPSIHGAVYEKQQLHTAAEFVDMQTRQSVKTAKLKTSVPLSVTTIRLAFKWEDVSMMLADDVVRYVHEKQVHVDQQAFKPRQPCLENGQLVLPIVSVSSDLGKIMTEIDADWNTAVYTFKESMPKNSNLLQLAGILAAVALHPHLSSYGRRSVGFMCLAMLQGGGSSAASALQALLTESSSLQAKHSRSLMAFANANAPFDGMILVLMRLAAVMHGGTGGIIQTLANVRDHAESDVTMRQEELQRLIMRMPDSSSGTVAADLCMNCRSVVKCDNSMRSSNLCEMRSIKTIFKDSVMCSHVDCSRLCCPCTAVGTRCWQHAELDIRKHVDEPELWRSWMAQGPTSNIEPGCLITMFTFDEPDEVCHLMSLALVIAIYNGHALLCYVDNCVPSIEGYNAETALSVRKMIETGNYPEVHIDMQATISEAWRKGGYWRLGRKKLRLARCVSRGKINIDVFDDVVKIFDVFKKAENTDYEEKMKIRMQMNRDIFSTLQGTAEDRLELLRISAPKDPARNCELESKIAEARLKLKNVTQRQAYVTQLTLSDMHIESPSACQYLCPITHEPCKNPVITADGHTYDEEAILQWFEHNNTSPLTGRELPNLNLIPNYALK